MTNRKELVLTFALAVLLAACPTPKMPDGPPPEYEDPPAPSWYGADAGAEDASTEPAVSASPAEPGDASDDGG